MNTATAELGPYRLEFLQSVVSAHPNNPELQCAIVQVAEGEHARWGSFYTPSKSTGRLGAKRRSGFGSFGVGLGCVAAR